MRRADYPRGKWWNVFFLLATLLVVAADQLSKIWIRSNLAPGESLFELGFFRIIHIRNSGAAFGLFQGHLFALMIVGLLGVVAILTYVLFFYRSYPFLDDRLVKLALGLVLGGTIGNLADRLNPNLAGVTDFIGVGIWPAFNIADSAIVVGVIMFAYSLLALARAKKR